MNDEAFLHYIGRKKRINRAEAERLEEISWAAGFGIKAVRIQRVFKDNPRRVVQTLRERMVKAVQRRLTS